MGFSRKPERQEAGRTDTWGEEKQEATRRYEPRGARSMEKQNTAFPERQEGNRDPKEYPSRERFAYDRQDSRNREVQEPSRRDIDKQDSWRRPVTPPAPAPAPSPLLDSSNRQNSGRLGYTAPASALELAQAFSRSTVGLGSASMNRSNSGNQRGGPASPGIRPGHGASSYHAGSMNGGYPAKDAAPFSRLAEAPVPPASYTDGYNGYHRAAAGYGNDSNWGPAYGSRTDDDFPGKRGLPLRRPYE